MLKKYGSQRLCSKKWGVRNLQIFKTVSEDISRRGAAQNLKIAAKISTIVWHHFQISINFICLRSAQMFFTIFLSVPYLLKFSSPCISYLFYPAFSTVFPKLHQHFFRFLEHPSKFPKYFLYFHNNTYFILF